LPYSSGPISCTFCQHSLQLNASLSTYHHWEFYKWFWRPRWFGNQVERNLFFSIFHLLG
jgi:hypothetical protein